MNEINSKTLDATYAKNALGSTFFCNIILYDNHLIVATTAGNVFLSFQFTIGAIYHKICLKKHKKVSKELEKLSSREILGYSKLNFQIDYADITKIELKKIKVFSKFAGARLTIYTNKKNYIYGLITRDKMSISEEQFEEYEKILKKFFSQLIVL